MSTNKLNNLSAIHLFGIIIFLGIAALLIFGETDKQRRDRLDKPEQVSRMARITALTNDYYSKGEVAAGTFGIWRVVSIKSKADNPYSDKINNINVRVEVDERTAKDILQRSSEGQLRAGASGCPPITHEIYSIMTNNDNLTLQVGVNGEIFVDVACSRWAGNIGAR